MANQTITVNRNHDELTGRLPGEDITIQLGSKLTIDSMPQHTQMGILGDILITSGEVHIDGRNVREITYSGGTGSISSTVPTQVTWENGSGKIIRYNSGNNISGVMTITVQSGVNPNGIITDGTWSSYVVTDKVGFLMIFGEDQVWDATDATCTIRINGDWYEIGSGNGLDNQSFTIPHNGWQHAVWVETGNNTNVFEIWHRVLQNGVNGSAASLVFFDDITDWGNTYETGFVFYNDRTTGTINFGTSNNGGSPPLGARIRIPNVHIGTTTTVNPMVEYVGVALASMLEIVDSSVSENVYIDHLNASTSQMSLVQINRGVISDSCFGMWNTTNIINICNNPVTITNCAFIGGTGLSGDSPALTFTIQDNVGGVTIDSCVFCAGFDITNATSGVNLITMSNLLVRGRTKFVNFQQDENSVVAFRAGLASNVKFEDDSIFLNAGLNVSTGCVNWDIENFIFSQLTSRGTTEDSMTPIAITGTDKLIIRGGRFAIGNGVSHMNTNFAILTDSSNVKIRNFGSVDNKINCGGRGTNVINVVGISSNCSFQRLYFSNRNTAAPFALVNSNSDIIFENCSCDYDDEMEPDANRCVYRGVHGGSGNIGAATGVEDDYVNVISSVFYDIFKSDTTGGVGLIFNDGGVMYSSYINIDSGNPIFNGIGDLLMLNVGDQITYTWPYYIKGHNGFTSILPHLLGVNAGTLGTSWGNFNVEYDLDNGNGFTGTFKTASISNLTSETIYPSGFGIKIRIICINSSTTNSLRGFQIHTSTSILDQKNNLYPLNLNNITFNNLKPNSEVKIYKTSNQELLGGIENSTDTYVFSYEYTEDIEVYYVVFNVNYQAIRVDGLILTDIDQDIRINQEIDRVYINL